MKVLSLLLALLLSSSPLWAAPDSFADIIQAEKEKVVHISTTSIKKNPRMDPFVERFFGPLPKNRKEQALGSGFIISADGYIVTNNHVIAGADTIEVTLYNSKKYQAKVIGTDPMSDLGLLKIKAQGLKYIEWGNSDQLKVGDWLLAIGNPFGLDHSVTAGILSARGRDIFGGTAYGQFLQTDAAINPGNSGGPLFNVQGQVVGINTAIAQGQGLGFAVPANLAKKIIRQLKKNGQVKRGWLGVGIQEINEDLARALNLPQGQKGIIVTLVGEKSPAASANLMEGDVIVEVNGKKVKKTTELQQLVAETPPGNRLTLKIYRQGKAKLLRPKVGTRPQETVAALEGKSEQGGVQYADLTPKLKAQFGIQANRGVLVLRIDPNGKEFEKGLRQGDLIVKAAGKKINSLKALKKILRSKGKGLVTVLVMRRNRPLFLALPRNP